jgi:FKBP-type peptidyl-prolyl cis-trans isomerase FkpA
MRSILIVLSVALISCSSKPEASPESTEKPAVSSNNDQKAYLEKAAAEPGAQKTASGLVYRDVTAGSGASPKATDTVKVHYRGTLIHRKE